MQLTECINLRNCRGLDLKIANALHKFQSLIKYTNQRVHHWAHTLTQDKGTVQFP